MVNIIRLTVLVLLCSISSSVFASDVRVRDTKIVRMISYNQFGNGDVVFRTESTSDICYGYWITKADDGFDANFSMLLSAYHSSSKINVYAYSNQRWAGSSNHWCKVYALEYLN